MKSAKYNKKVREKGKRKKKERYSLEWEEEREVEAEVQAGVGDNATSKKCRETTDDISVSLRVPVFQTPRGKGPHSPLPFLSDPKLARSWQVKYLARLGGGEGDYGRH